MKAKVYLNKMGAQLKKIEKKVVHMEEWLEHFLCGQRRLLPR